MGTTTLFTTMAKKPWCILWVLVLLVVTMSAAQAQNPRYAGIVVDMDNGEVLYAENQDAPRYPASLTKMMTLYLLFEALENGELSLDDGLPVSAQAAAMPATKLWLSAGSSVPVDTAIRALVVRSANDVAVVVAEALGGSEQRFANLMTAKARELGMEATTFRNASGLPDDQQRTTARDMLTLSVRVMQDFPEYYHYFGLQAFTYRGKRYTGHNRLLSNYPGADGLKTGFIRASGFNVATTAVHDGRRMVAVVMGGFSSSSRDTHMANLLDRGFGRAALRDRYNWLARTHFSEEFMSFGPPRPVSPTSPSPAPIRQAPAPQSRPEPTVVADAAPSVEATSLSPAPASERQVQAQLNEPGSGPDPLEALIADQSSARSSSSAADNGDWGIQVGAFSHSNQAEQLAQQAARRLPDNVQGRVAIDTLGGQTPIFRARVMALDETRARQACQALQAQGMDCMVVNASL